MPAPSIEGRRFRDVTDDRSGDVGPETIFEYHQDGDIVWARYVGGSINTRVPGGHASRGYPELPILPSHDGR